MEQQVLIGAAVGAAACILSKKLAKSKDMMYALEVGLIVAPAVMYPQYRTLAYAGGAALGYVAVDYLAKPKGSNPSSY